MPKKMILTEQDYWSAWRVYNGDGIISIDNNPETEWKLPPSRCEERLEHYLPPSPSNPERELLRKEALNALSSEAKQIIDMLINSPSEVLKAVSTPTGHITKRSIRLGMQKIWHSKFIAKKVIEELTQWANQL